ncbi:MAG: HEAT repeat domain-containing protein, partial [Thermodesulfobacteriota bacterium]
MAIILNLSFISHDSISDEAGKEPELSGQTNPSQHDGLMRALDDPNPMVRAIAINNLAELNYEPALPRIVEFIKAENTYTKIAAINAVVVMDQLTPDTASLIIENLSNKDSRVRYSSVRALSQYSNLNDKQIP